MITQYEVPSLLREELPQLAGKIQPTNVMIDVYKSVNYFTNYAKEAVRDHHFNLAKKCFILAEKLYRNGDNIVRMAIENIFVYSFSSFMPIDRIEKLILQSIIPASLNAVYLKQVTSSNC